jgi:hypothetical protein
MLEHILGIEPATDDEKPKPRRTQADKWALNLAAAKPQFYECEGHLRVPRKHVNGSSSATGTARTRRSRS